MLITILVVIFVYSLFEYGIIRFNYPDNKMYPIVGLDISHHQGNINWNEINKNEIKFVYLKATEGGDWVDKKFLSHWRSAKQYDIKVGAYHFYRICKTGKEQANNFIKTVPIENALAPVVDLEYLGNCKTVKSRRDIIHEIEDFLHIVGNHYAKDPIIYTTYEFYNEYVEGEFLDKKIWIRDIFCSPKKLDGRGWVIWQFTNRGRVKGIEKVVDMNVFNGNESDFNKFVDEHK